MARSIKDYYDIMLAGVVFIIILLIVIPGTNKIYMRLKAGSLPY